MCGFAGSISLTGHKIGVEKLGRATQALAHRGPDDRGYFSWSRDGGARAEDDINKIGNGEVLLGHRRLAIQDLSRAGWQPFVSEGGARSLVYNGEIYNFIEHRKQLQGQGVEFRSQSDTEVLMRLWEKKQIDCLQHLIGMFSFCVFDSAARQAFLVRDFFGIKPLYYAVENGVLHFASEIRALLELRKGPRRADLAVALEYLAYSRSDHGENTMVVGVKRVLPGEVLKVSLDGSERIDRARYWALPSPTLEDASHVEASAALRAQFLNSVDLHLRSDARVGVALSGGIDSSAILAAIRHLKGDQVDIHSYSYISDDSSISEERWVDIAGHHARAAMHKVRPTQHEFDEDIDDHIVTNNEPMGYFNGYLGRRVYRQMQQDGIKVSLDGQGADELFAGYDAYYMPALVTLLLSNDFLGAARLNHRLTRLGFSSGLSTLLREFVKSKASTVSNWLRRPPTPPPWLRDDLRHMLAATLGATASPRADLATALKTSVYSGLQRLLRCQDLNSMASSVESRVPFLTPQLAQLAFTVPMNFHIDETGVRKALLRHALNGVAADETLARADKQAAPTTNWLRQNSKLVEAALDKSEHPARALFDKSGLGTLRSSFYAGRPSASPAMWRIVNFIRWCELLNIEAVT